MSLQERGAHTPGPWSDPHFDSNPGDSGWWVHNGSHGGKEYAVCVTFSGNPCAYADATLISASPLMLHALQSFPAERDYVTPLEYRAAIERWWSAVARHAIAKATGTRP